MINIKITDLKLGFCKKRILFYLKNNLKIACKKIKFLLIQWLGGVQKND